MSDLISSYFYNKLSGKTDSALNEVWEFLQRLGGYEKYTKAGTYTFVVPPRVETIVVSAIGGGGGGGGGGNYWNSNYASGGGGGGGGYGYSELDQIIQVTPGEQLTVVIGAGGNRGEASSVIRGTTGSDGANGEATLLKRGETVLLTASGATGGGLGQNPSDYNTGGTGGPGGSIGGTSGGKGDDSYSHGGTGGTGGVSPIFKSSGAGGNGGTGEHDRVASEYGKNGTAGAMCICWGENATYKNIIWG